MQLIDTTERQSRRTTAHGMYSTPCWSHTRAIAKARLMGARAALGWWSDPALEDYLAFGQNPGRSKSDAYEQIADSVVTSVNELYSIGCPERARI
ncbi:MAG: hypothetical protein ACLU37_04795 [Collinsella sp.]